VDIAVLFADVRGSTSIAENVWPSEFATLLNRFYKVAMDALIPRKAIITR
jgi:adenylate cyclase